MGQLITNTFDPVSRQTTMQDLTGGVTAYGYDLAGRQTSVKYGKLSKILTYSYDSVSNRLGLIDPDSLLTTYGNDPVGNVTSLVNGQGERTTLTYDPLNRQQQRVLGNNSAVSTIYDALGRTRAIQALTSAGVPLELYTYTYDAIGNRLTASELDGSQASYGYDASYQLVNEQRTGANAYNTTYTYDGPGNRLTKNDSGSLTNYIYNGANEQTLIAPATGAPNTLSYDANGNLALENSGGSLTSYTWDIENRLTKVMYPDATRDTFTYLANGRRLDKRLAASNVSNAVLS